MNKIYCLMASFLMAFNITFSQNSISGKVYDKITKEPLVGVSVIIPNTQIGCTANANGYFTLLTEHASDSVEVRFVGYKTERFKATDQKSINIALSPSTETIQEIVVTASRDAQTRTEVPLAISKISATTINDTKATLITELINKVPGVAMLNLNNEQHGMSIRQPMGTSNYFLYMEDGIPVRPMGVFNHNALIEMNIFAISSVEVVKGPASSLYGPEAVGGAINFITQKPTAVFTAKAGIQFDNFGYKRIQYGTGGGISKKLGFYLGGFYAQQRDGWMSNSDYDKNSINARLDYELTQKTKLIFAGSFNDYYSQTGGSVDSIAFYSRNYVSTTDFTYRKVRSLRTRLSAEHKWNENNNTSLHLFYRDNSIGQNPAYSIRWVTGKKVATGQVNVNSVTSKGFILQHVADIKPIKTKIIGGLSLDNSPNSYNAYQIDLAAQLRPDGLSVEKYTINEERPDIKLADYSATLLNYAAYLQAEIKPVKKVSITLGGRYDVMSFNYENYLDVSSGIRSYEQFSPKVGLIIFSQYDNQLRKEKCMAGVKEALLRGEWCHKAPYGYDQIIINKKRQIVLNEKGKLLQKAFYWKANEEITNNEISKRFEKYGVKLDEKRLSIYFRNPFYCGLIAHASLGGELVEGNHEKMIPKEIFLKVNNFMQENSQGYSIHEENEVIPLKRFLKCGHCSEPMRGYIVKSKNIPYYKCNTKGCCNNKNANDIHHIFETGLEYLTFLGNEGINPLIKNQIIKAYRDANKEEKSDKEAKKRELIEINKKLERLEERLVLEEITAEIFNKYSEKLKEEKAELERELEKAPKQVSNLEHCVKEVMEFASKLATVWRLLPYKDKQIFQKLIFPEGICYDKKNGQCRTTKINSVFRYISQLVKDVAKIKMGESKLIFDFPHWVGPLGIEPSTHRL